MYMKLLHLPPLWKKVEGEKGSGGLLHEGKPHIIFCTSLYYLNFFFLLYASFILVAIQEAK